MAETKRLKVFLCHAHSDAAVVRDLFRYLRREGVDVWLDKESLLPGQDWNTEIRKAVRASDVVVVCLSNEFSKAGYRQREVKLALDTEQEKPEGEIYIIPARLEVCDVPESLSKWQWVDLFEEGGRRKLIQALRIRADQIGASLRRRGNYGRPAPQDAEDDFEDMKPALNPATPPYSDYPTVELPAAPERVDDIDFPERKETHSGFWVDDTRNVWRGSKKLGTLGNDIQSALLTNLIEHKGEVCRYVSLWNPIYSLLPAWMRNAQKAGFLNIQSILFEHVKRIRDVIESDPMHPKFLTEVAGKGYKLDW